MANGRKRVVVAVAVASVVLLLADAVYAGLRLRSSLTSGACGLKRAADALRDFDTRSARKHFTAALSDIDSASGSLRHPSFRLAGAIPGLERELDVLDSLTEAADRAARSGLIGVATAAELGVDASSGLGDIYRDGRVDLGALEGANDDLRVAATHLRSAAEALRDAPRARIGRIRGARTAALELVTEAMDSLDDTNEVLADLPGLLGGSGTRRYFLAFQAPSEARGGGGLIGVYGLLEARAGRLELTRVAPIRTLVPRLKGKVAGPAWFQELYGGLDGLGGWREANSSPTFPTVARVLLRMYERSTGKRLDGAMAMDPVVVAELLRATGPVRVPGAPEPISAESAPGLLMRDIYLDYAGAEDAQNAFLRELVDRLWKRLGGGEVDAKALRGALTRSVASQRLKFFSTHDVERDSVEILGMDGDPRSFGDNLQMFFHNNFAANKIDWFLHRAQSTTMSVNRDGSADVVTTVSLHNKSPRGQRSLLKKSDVNELPSGLNLMSAHLTMPAGAEVKEVYLGSTPTRYSTGMEAGTYPQVWLPLQLPVMSRAALSVSYRVPDLVRFRNGRAVLDLTLIPQATVRPDRFSLRVTAPEGLLVGGVGRKASFGPSHEVSGSLDRVRKLKTRILPRSAAESWADSPHFDRGNALSGVCE